MRRLMMAHPETFGSVLSITTRPRRGMEDDRWYRFVTREEIASFDPADVLSMMEFRGEHYVTLKSEIERAYATAPVVLMAIVPTVILRMRELNVPHVLINCRVGDRDGYARRLGERGFTGEKLSQEIETGMSFPFPSAHPVWPSVDVALGFSDDDARFDDAVCSLLPDLSAVLRP